MATTALTRLDTRAVPRTRRRLELEILRRSSLTSCCRVGAALSALGLALLASPLLVGRALWGRYTVGSWLEWEPRLSRHGRTMACLFFAGPAPGRDLAQLWHVVTGEWRWVGPRALPPAEHGDLRCRDLVRLEATPGLVSLATVRRRMGLAHDGVERLERAMALEWRRRDSPALLLRAGVAALLGGAATRSAPPIIAGDQGDQTPCKILGVEIDDRTMAEAIGDMTAAAREGRRLRVAFVNPDCLNIASRRHDYLRALCSADRVYADGIGLRLAARWLGQPLSDNVNGTDLFPRLCRRAAAEDLSLFLLGGRPGVAAAAARRLVERFPGLRIAGTHHGYFAADTARGQENDMRAEIRASGADIVLVGLGAPYQDLWLAECHGQLGSPVVVGVGGLFDFFSGRIRRAPIAFRELGLEWLWRLGQEPGRLWKRYFVGNPLFLWRVFRWRDHHPRQAEN